jgi:hypothetical protein
MVGNSDSRHFQEVIKDPVNIFAVSRFPYQLDNLLLMIVNPGVSSQ